MSRYGLQARAGLSDCAAGALGLARVPSSELVTHGGLPITSSGPLSRQVSSRPTSISNRSARQLNLHAVCATVGQNRSCGLKVRFLDFDRLDFARGAWCGKQAGDEMTTSTGGLQNARPAFADRADRLKDLCHQFRRGLEITEVASHPEGPSFRRGRRPGHSQFPGSRLPIPEPDSGGRADHLILAPTTQFGSSTVSTTTFSPDVAASSIPFDGSPRNIAGSRLLTITINLPTS